MHAPPPLKRAGGYKSRSYSLLKKLLLQIGPSGAMESKFSRSISQTILRAEPLPGSWRSPCGVWRAGWSGCRPLPRRAWKADGLAGLEPGGSVGRWWFLIYPLQEGVQISEVQTTNPNHQENAQGSQSQAKQHEQRGPNKKNKDKQRRQAPRNKDPKANRIARASESCCGKFGLPAPFLGKKCNCDLSLNLPALQW